MKGFFYRLGSLIKDAGELEGHKRRFYAGSIIRLGLLIQDLAAR